MRRKKSRAAGWRILEDFVFNLGFCQIDSRFGEALGFLIFLLAATFLLYFPASLLFLDCTVNSRIPPPGFFSPPMCLGRPAHIFSCLQQTGLQLSTDLFYVAAISFAWSHLSDERLVVLWLSWGARSVAVTGGIVSMEITDQSVVLLGDLLPRDNLDISHMLAEGFAKKHKDNLSPSFTLGEGKQVIGLLFKKGVADDQVAGFGSNLSPSVFLVPLPWPSCTPSYPSLDLPTWLF